MSLFANASVLMYTFVNKRMGGYSGPGADKVKEIA